MVHYNRLVLNFDGASRDNPRGPAGCGWVLSEMSSTGYISQTIARDSDYLGYHVTNNQAEYKGLINGLDYMVRNSIGCNKLFIRGDSKLVINQMEGRYTIKSHKLKEYHNEAKESLDQIEASSYVFRHVTRDANSQADSLANQAIQRGS